MHEPTVTRTIRISETLVARVGEVAALDGTSVNRLIVDAVRRRIAEVALASGIESGDAVREVDLAMERLREAMKPKVKPTSDDTARRAAMNALRARLDGDR